MITAISYDFDNVDLSQAGIVTSLYDQLKVVKNFENLSIQEIYSMSLKRKDVASLLVGLWGEGLLKNPLFNSEKDSYETLKNYQREYFTEEEKKLLIHGVISIIRYSHIEMSDDHNAIDFIYSACRCLYAVIPDRLETLLVEQFRLNPTPSFIDAIGVLVRLKNSITKETYLLLENATDNDDKDIAFFARNILETDVIPMNEIYHFL